MTKQQNQDFNSLNLILFLWKWRIPIVIVIFVAAVAAAGISYTITPKYKSTVILYPTSTNSISKALLSENFGLKQDIMEFGEEEQTEQLLQILSSNKIRAKIIEKYDLMNHYEIPADGKYKHTRLFKEYESNIKFRRTEYMAVEISVLDTDPQMAADIANDIAALLDSVKNQMQKERAFQGFQIVESEYNQLKNEIQRMEDSLTSLRKLGVHDYESQSERLNEQLATALAQGNMPGVKRIEERLNNLALYGGAYVSIRDALEHEKKQLSLIKAKYEEVKVDAEEFIPQKFVVDSAYKAEKKSYPVRWLIVIVSAAAAFVLSILVIIVIDTISRSKKNKKTEEESLSQEN